MSFAQIVDSKILKLRRTFPGAVFKTVHDDYGPTWTLLRVPAGRRLFGLLRRWRTLAWECDASDWTTDDPAVAEQLADALECKVVVVPPRPWWWW